MTETVHAGEDAEQRPGAPVRLRALGAAVGPPAEALQHLWLSGFWAGAICVAPDRVRRCQGCAEPFVAAHRRERYCGPRCRNRVMKRRYRARLRAASTAGKSP